jgi:hypothetical protein
LDTLDERFYLTTRQDKDTNIETKIYQFQAFTPKISGIKLNIVVLVHTHQISHKVSRTILFSNDLTLDARTLIHYLSGVRYFYLTQVVSQNRLQWNKYEN